jgi:hypothetical protein
MVIKMKVFVDNVKKRSDYNDQSKWIDYHLLIYLISIYDMN